MIKRIISICLMAVSLIACEDKDPQAGADYPLKAFSISVNQRMYHAEIDQETMVARIGAIKYTGEINAVNYKLAEGMSISPNPARLVNSWSEKQKFTISDKDGKTYDYTVVLTAYEGRWPEKPGEVIFLDEFDGSLDEDTWTRITPTTSTGGFASSGSPMHSYTEDGNLVLKIEKVDGKTQAGGIKSEYKKWFRNCRIEIRAKWDDGGGTVARSLWLMPQHPYYTYPGWPEAGELDIMEHNYWTSYIRQTVHSYYIHNIGDYTDSSNPPAGRVTFVGASQGYKEKDWNVYAVDMTGEDVIWYVNGNKTGTYSNRHLENEEEVKQWPFAAPFYLILTVGPNGKVDCNTEDLPATMLIDYVRVTRL